MVCIFYGIEHVVYSIWYTLDGLYYMPYIIGYMVHSMWYVVCTLGGPGMLQPAISAYAKCSLANSTSGTYRWCTTKAVAWL